MVATLQHKTTHTIKIEYCDEPVTSFGGLVLAERMAERLGLWRSIAGHLPARGGGYGWMEILKSVTLGLHSGAQGTFAAQSLRGDAALLRMLGLAGAPEEATVWRSLEGLGTFQAQGLLPKVQALMARRTLEKMNRGDLLVEGFVPVFADGTLLEGSSRREGSKYIEGKGEGLMWSGVFVGRVLSAQRLAPKGGGEHSDVLSMLLDVQRQVLRPLRMEREALVLLDSLHGDDTCLSQLEGQGLHYVAGANKLKLAEKTLSQRAEWEWESRGARPRFGWAESAVCACWIQCEDWKKKRLLVGRRWRREGEVIWNYAGVVTDLREKDLGRMMEGGRSLARSVWRLYDAKAGMETLFSDGLSDLGLHHPPCQGYQRNAGFYALAALAWVLGTAVDAIGGQDNSRANMTRKDGNPRRRATPSRMRFWRLRRELFALPGRIACHGREMVVRLLGLGESARALFDRYWTNICGC